MCVCVCAHASVHVCWHIGRIEVRGQLQVSFLSVDQFVL